MRRGVEEAAGDGYRLFRLEQRAAYEVALRGSGRSTLRQAQGERERGRATSRSPLQGIVVEGGEEGFCRVILAALYLGLSSKQR